MILSYAAMVSIKKNYDIGIDKYASYFDFTFLFVNEMEPGS